MRLSAPVRARERGRPLLHATLRSIGSTAMSRAIERVCATNASTSAHRSAFVQHDHGFDLRVPRDGEIPFETRTG